MKLFLGHETPRPKTGFTPALQLTKHKREFTYVKQDQIFLVMVRTVQPV